MLRNLYVVMCQFTPDAIASSPSIPQHGWKIGGYYDSMDRALRAARVDRSSHTWLYVVILSFSPLTGVAVRDHGNLYTTEFHRIQGLGEEDALELAAQIAGEYSDRITAVEQHDFARAEMAHPAVKRDMGTGSAIIE